MNTFHNNKKHNGGKDGNKFCGQSTSKQSSCYDNCWFSMLITCADIGFYNLSHMEYENHQNHPNLSQEEIIYQTRLLETSEKILLDNIGKANMINGISINVLYGKKVIHLDRY